MSDKQQKHQKSKSKSFSFQNLQPINYLKTFNKMLQHINKPVTNLTSTKNPSMKLTKLSKFPIYEFYAEMQGISEGPNKKDKQKEKLTKKDLQFSQNQQKFVKKHNKFVQQTLKKIIKDNESQRNMLFKSKHFYLSQNRFRESSQYQQQIINLVKTRSTPKLRSLRNSNKLTSQTIYTSGEKKDSNEVQKQKKSRTQKLIHKRATSISTDVKSRKKSEFNNMDRSNFNNNSQSSQANQRKISQSHHHKQQHNNKQEKINLSRNLNKNDLRNNEWNPIFKKLKFPSENQRFRTKQSAQMDHYFAQIKNQPNIKDKTYFAQTERPIYDYSQDQKVQQLIQNKLAETVYLKKDIRKQMSLSDRKGSELQPINKINPKNKNQDQKRVIDRKESSFNFESMVEKLQMEQRKRQGLFSQQIESKIRQVSEQVNRRMERLRKERLE